MNDGHEPDTTWSHEVVELPFPDHIFIRLDPACVTGRSGYIRVTPEGN